MTEDERKLIDEANACVALKAPLRSFGRVINLIDKLTEALTLAIRQRDESDAVIATAKDTGVKFFFPHHGATPPSPCWTWLEAAIARHRAGKEQ